VTVQRAGNRPELGPTDHPVAAPERGRGTVDGVMAAHGDGTCLHLDGATRSDASKRLKSVRGHVEGVLRMLDDPNVYCVDVLKQVSAVQGALRKVSEGVLRAHVRDHVTTAALRGDTEHIVDELMEALKYRA
jgi:CsoR family transcriptional regulator, copper-sensing transcriptional repressor